jgi:tetratricopeptide (TPR) repeat protein
MSSVNVNIVSQDSSPQVDSILDKSSSFQELVDELAKKEKELAHIPENETEKRLSLGNRINELKTLIEQFKKDVVQLAEAFLNIEVNTSRLKQAREFFDLGNFDEAKKLLEADLNEMLEEHQQLLKERTDYENRILPLLKNNSEEFYILALSTQSDYTNPNRFRDTCRYFELSIESFETKDNLFNYAYFLDINNQFIKARKYYELQQEKFGKELSLIDSASTLNNLAGLHMTEGEYDQALKVYEEAIKIYRELDKENVPSYKSSLALTLNNLGILYKVLNEYEKASAAHEEALQITRKLAEDFPQTYLPSLALTLNNLGSLQINQNEFEKALSAFNEALEIYQKLNEENPRNYLPDLAVTYNNFGIVYSRLKNVEQSSSSYEESLKIYRQLAAENPQAYLPSIALTLNNLGVLHDEQKESEKALAEYEEALKIRRQLAEENPHAYLSDVAQTLNNLGALYKEREDCEKGLKKYEESLEIYRKLAADNPQTFQPDVAMVLINIAECYQDFQMDKEKSLEYVWEAIYILFPIMDKIPYTQKYMEYAMDILKGWGFSFEEIDKKIEEKVKEMSQNISQAG